MLEKKKLLVMKLSLRIIGTSSDWESIHQRTKERDHFTLYCTLQKNSFLTFTFSHSAEHMEF